eukprot:3166228-Rhodomonas_salina.1
MANTRSRPPQSGGSPIQPARGARELCLKDFTIDREIARNSAGSVCKAKHLGSGRSVVLKARRNPEIGKDGDIAHEVEILQSVNHPNIIKCFGSFWNKATGYFYMVSNPSRAIHLLCLPNCCAARARISVHKPTLDVRLMS